MKSFKYYFLAMFLTLGFLTQAQAFTSVSVSPTELTMNPEQGKIAETLVVRNASEKPVTLQALVQTWTQDAKGAFVLSSTDDLLILPSTFEVAPSAVKNIRIVNRKTHLPKPGQALYYRVLVKELPKFDLSSDKIALHFTVGFSVPLYVENQYDPKDFKLHASLQGSELTLANEGPAHLKAFGVLAGKESIAPLTYVLPGSQKTFELNPAALAFLKQSPELTIKLNETDSKTIPLSH